MNILFYVFHTYPRIATIGGQMKIFFMFIFFLLCQCGHFENEAKKPLFTDLSHNNGSQLVLTIENGSEKSKRSAVVRIDTVVVFDGQLRNRRFGDMQFVYAKIDTGTHHVFATFGKKQASYRLKISGDTTWCKVEIVSLDTILIQSQNKKYLYD
jgi:hypothetical protein